MLASVSPVNIRPMALARLLGGTTSAATTAPTPNSVPWAKAASDAGDDQERVAGRDRREEIADDEDADHEQEDALARHAARWRPRGSARR